MVWGLATALVAGILRDYRLLPLGLALVLGMDARCARGAVFATLTTCAFFAFGLRSNFIRVAAERCIVSVAASGEVALRGEVSDYPSSAPGGTRFELATVIAGRRIHILVRAPVFGLGYGDSVLVVGAVEPPNGTWANYLRGRGVVGSVRARVGDVRPLEGGGGSVMRRGLWAIHEHARCLVCRCVGTRAAVPLALLLGDRGFIEPRMRRALARLGVSHLFALSGMHLGLIAAGLYWGLRRFRRGRRLGLVAGLAVYVGVVGPIPSLCRAFVMVAVLTAAAGLHRPIRPLTALGDAFLLLLLVSPHVLFAVGFQLSFLATLAVLLCVERLRVPRSRRRGTRFAFWIRSTLAVSGSVQVLLAPVALRYFGQLSLAGPLATLLLVTPVMGLFAGSVLSVGVASVLPPSGPALFWVMERATGVFATVVLWLAQAADPTVALPTPHFGFYYAGVGLLGWPGNGWWGRGLGVLLVAGSFLGGWLRG